MTVKGGTSQACAACKYQRRRCSADCALAPYFPPSEPKMFQNAHRLFGVSNILKILKQLNPNDKDEAMRSIIYQSNMREKYPVLGCYGIIVTLRYQIQQHYIELEAVNNQLAIFRQQQQQQQHHMPPSPPPASHHSPSSQLQLGTTTASPNNGLSHFQPHPQQQQQQQQPYNLIGNNGIPIATHQAMTYSGNNVATYNASAYVESKDNVVMNSMWWVQQQQQQQQQHPYNQSNNNTNPMMIQSQYAGVQGMPLQQQAVETPQDYDEMPAFFDTIDDRVSYIDSKEHYESSSDDSLKDTTRTIEHVSENELKSAAACFTLTSVN